MDTHRLLRYNKAILGEGAHNARGPRKGELDMPVSEAQKKASAKYLDKLDEVRIRMPKGRKDVIQAHASAQGESVNGFINRAIIEAMERDAAGIPSEAAGPEE